MTFRPRAHAPDHPAGRASPIALDSEAVALTLGLLAVSCLFLGLRLYAAGTVGFGDSEALYACYALHPQPSYVDHPGLIGVVARALSQSDGTLTPAAAHTLTSALATLFPFALLAAARAFGAPWVRSLRAALVVACVPELAVGLFGMTPDLVLAFGWPAALALAIRGLREPPSSARAALFLSFAGLAAGVACASKVTGALLLVTLIAAYAQPRARAHARTVWPWLGLMAAAVVLAPVAVFEVRGGFPMLRHRLLDTQAGAGPSLRNLGGLVFGQLGYLSPLLAYCGVRVARDLVRKRDDDEATFLLFVSFAIPLLPLVLLTLFSPVAEPHWLSPPLLALPLHYARTSPEESTGRRSSARLVIAATLLGLLLSLGVYAWALIPASARLLPTSVDPRADLATELYGWGEPVSVVRDLVASERARDDDPLVVVGPHWTVCAQLHAALGGEIPVGCDTAVRDDFDTWVPRPVWRRAAKLVYVTDSRFPDGVVTRFPDRFRVMGWVLPQRRGGRVVRTFRIALLERRKTPPQGVTPPAASP